MHHRDLEYSNYVDKIREPIKKLEDKIMVKLIDHIGLSEVTFEDQNRNIHANCCICNDNPEYSIVIDKKFSYIYICYTCRKRFEPLQRTKIS